MESPRVLKSYMITISLLAVLMTLNIITSVHYLYTTVVVLPQSVVANHHQSVVANHHQSVVANHHQKLSRQAIMSDSVIQTNIGLNITVKTVGDAVQQKTNGTVRSEGTTGYVHGNRTKTIGSPLKQHRNGTANKTKPTTAVPTKPPRADNCTGCFKHDFEYLLQNKTICNHGTHSTIDLLIVVFTIHKNVKERNAIRQTWLDISKGNSANVRYAFLLGKIDNKELMSAVVNETKLYGDIIMEDFKDSYVNLTYKTIMGLKWASLYCSDARFVMKTDDDMWVNTLELVKLLATKEKELQKGVGGACSNVASPIRNRYSKWYASTQSYPHRRYPGFCSGTGYVTSMGVAKKLYQVSPDVPFFHLEDVYVALCIKKLGMTLVRLKGFHNWRTALNPCQMRSAAILTSHQVPSDFLHKVMAANCSSVVKQPDVKG